IGVGFGMFFFFSSRRRHTRSKRDWSSDVCSSDLPDNSSLEIRHHGKRIGRGTWAPVVGEPLGAAKRLFEDLAPEEGMIAEPSGRSEERRVGKECRSRWAA